MTELAPVNLTGIPETMLWTLHNRASEAKRPDAILRDPDAIRIYESVRYDFKRSFGKPDGSHAMRSRIFDDAVRPWMAKHPGGTVVELAAGLETEFQRCDDGKVRWICVDVPEAIAVRERFLKANDRCKYVSKSALDFSWMDEVDGSRGVFVTAQGLLMYFHEKDVRRLFRAIVERFPGVELMFDVIPRWFSKKTLVGLRKTKHYIAPPMPWGVNRSEVKRLIESWSPRITSVEQVSFGYFRGAPGLLLPVFSKVPIVRDVIPSIVRVRTSRWTS
ncbi:class I SAM-dependent methyltransferase [Polyangium mundeleinium]|uniref:Class I SAM-dependent methyltransferase n=1 Tax=Polyangium mundeleinium TaxID=2995306 RepID=A0ABT5F2L7_9BACT|nr:class I SAM-dependent methyltransferase [Polyangium mundeleinium]MDC0747326.1 class I SAM-dependent methyltransferase [Polyangium mundeleinium]